MCEPRRGILRNSNMGLASTGTTVPRDATSSNWKNCYAGEITKAQRESIRARSDMQLWEEQEVGDDNKENSSNNLTFSPGVDDEDEDPADEILSMRKPTVIENDSQNCSYSSRKERHSLGRSCKAPVELSDDYSTSAGFHDLSSLVSKLYEVVETSRHLDAKIAEINKESRRLLSEAERTKTK